MLGRTKAVAASACEPDQDARGCTVLLGPLGPLPAPKLGASSVPLGWSLTTTRTTRKPEAAALPLASVVADAGPARLPAGAEPPAAVLPHPCRLR